MCQSSEMDPEAGGLEAWIRTIDRLPEVAPMIDVACLLTPEQEFISIEESGARAYGIDPGEVIGKECFRVVHDRGEPIEACPCRETVDTGEPAVGEVFEEHGRYFVPSTAPITDQNGDLMAVAHTITDVTDRVERQNALRRYERAIQNSTDLICATDRDDQYLFANERYCEFHGIAPEQVSQLGLGDVLSEDVYEQVKPHVDQALEGTEVTYTMTRSGEDGSDRIFDIRYYPLERETATTGIVAVMRDITEREHTRRQLRVIDNVLRHEIRNEMTVVRGRARQLKSNTDGELADAAESILRKANDLLAKSAKSREIASVLGEEPRLSEFEVRSVIVGIVEAISEGHPDAKFYIDAKQDLRCTASSRFPRAMRELVENAILHNDEEQPRVVISAAQTSDTVSIRISDDGPGIPDMDRAVLVSGKNPEVLHHGSGVGLWLVHWIINRSRGNIQVIDRDPQGTIVKLELPRDHAGPGSGTYRGKAVTNQESA